MNKDVLVIIDLMRGNLSSSSLEVLAVGKSLAEKTGGELHAILFGANTEPLAENVGKRGATKVYYYSDERLTMTNVNLIIENLIKFLKENPHGFVLESSTLMSFELLSAIANELDASLLPSCTKIDVGEYTDPATGEKHENVLIGERPIFEEKLVQVVGGKSGKIQMASLRPGSAAQAEEVSNNFEAIKMELHVPENLVEEVLEEKVAEQKVDISKAKLIVAGGRGVGGKEQFQIIHEVAKALGGVPGASRAAVDAGWIEYDYEIGQSGKTVSPDIYIACGISGAIQHVIGMKNSKKVIVINTDPEAPIWEIADYGIVGDLHEVLPLLKKKLE